MDASSTRTDLLASLADGVAGLTSSTAWRAWLDVQAPDFRTRDEVQTSSGRSSFGNVRSAPLIEVSAGDR